MATYNLDTLFPGLTENALRLLAISPFEKPDVVLCRRWIKAGGIAAVDVGHNPVLWPKLFQRIARDQSGCLGVRVAEAINLRPEQLPDNVAFVVLNAQQNVSQWQAWPVIVQVTSLEQALKSLDQGAHGLIAKGRETGGEVGDESAYILLQRLLADERLSGVPVWSQGGIGFHTAAAAIAGGAFGVVLDNQLALLSDSTTDPEQRALLEKCDGTESRIFHDYAIFARPNMDGVDAETLTKEQLIAKIRQGEITPWGQDAALARILADRCPNSEALIHQLRIAITGHLRQAKALKPLSKGAPMAQQQGTRYPIVQGPMTRVSDTAEFANAVADNGALPFLALSLMNKSACEDLLSRTQGLLGDKSWGVGVLGFAPPDLLQAQLALISHYKPKAVLIAGGRPSQARALEEQGIQSYLHVPAPGLLNIFLKEGARSFIFEGQECGGHVGPRFSFVLWEQQIHALLAFEQPQELNILFAGGVHDERSAAMVAAASASLAARGAKIGVLMGSAYITTREAVETKAVNALFQEQVISSERTVLLETAPGHATRGLATPFVDYFEQQKQQLTQQGLDKKAIWNALETLNVGRLRLATKGVERDAEQLVARDTATQLESGMYMIGQVAAMRHDVCSMAQLHQSVSDSAMAFLQAASIPDFYPQDDDHGVAIVGMACIYPGAENVEQYWANIMEGKDLVREVPPERWSTASYFEPNSREAGKTPSKWGGFIDDLPFNPLDYGIPPQSLAAIEPVQLLSLVAAHQALVDAGYTQDLSDLEKEKTSVIFGAESGSDLSNAYVFRNLYEHYLGVIPAELDDVLPSLTEDSFPGVLANVIAGRIANRLDLGGVNYTVDSACASSLTAVELAVKELRAGTSDVVLAGGADFHNGINDFLMFASVTALSASGKCQSFDSQADGIALGEGVGVVVLKRLADAKLDGDRIYAVIEGIAGSSDGKSLGLTAPRKEGQQRSLDRAYHQAGILPGDVGLVEAHGTGTVVGDKTELATLTEIYNQGGALNQQTVLGSVKSQIGHTKCAAGIAGLIKISKALHHKVLPPTQNITSPNSYYQADNSPFTLDKQPRPWLTDKPKAAISAFGFGGTNFHAVLSASHPREASQKNDNTSGQPQWPMEIFVFRGDPVVVQTLAQQCKDFIRTGPQPRLRDLSFTVWQAGQGPVQAVLLARHINELQTLLSKLLQGEDDEHIVYRHVSEEPEGNGPKVAFLFPGQGSQSPGMLRDIFLAFEPLQDILAAGEQWLPQLFPSTAYDRATQKRQKQAITDTRIAQPTLGMANFAMASVLEGLGLRADMLAGHSYGELVALSVAGCFDLHDLLSLSAARGQSIVSAVEGDPGCMAAVSAHATLITEVLRDVEGIVLANQNSPEQTVISGFSASIAQALTLLKEAGIAARPINVACAFHSPVLAKAEHAFAESLSTLSVKAPSRCVYSNTTAQAYPLNEQAIKQRLAEHIVRPVRFVEQIEAMYDEGARVFIEVGPGQVLSGLVRKTLGDKPYHSIVTDRTGQSGIPSLLMAIAKLLSVGKTLNLDYLYQGRGAVCLDLSNPVEYPKTLWWVNGARAKPHHGALPPQAAKEITQAVAVNSVRLDSHGSASGRLNQEERNVEHYLNNVRDMVHAQRDVMLAMFGQPTSSNRTALTPLSDKTADTIIENPVTTPDVSTSPSAQSSHVAPANVQQCLIAIVSDRTGYPADMLDLDLDLEADLSIDSIKRVEIIAQLSEDIGFRQLLGNDSDRLMEQLAAQKSLREILSWLQQQLPEAQELPEKSAARTTQQTKIDVQGLLLHIVSERTGYPEDVLDVDLDLEADLSIDSIKRLEIVAELAEKLGLEETLADKDAALESLAALKTLKAMVQWLSEQAGHNRKSIEPLPQTFDDIDSTPESLSSVELSRYIVKTTSAPDVIKGDSEFKGKQFLITDDTLGIAKKLTALLELHGASVRVISFHEEDPLPNDLTDVDGLVHLWGLNPQANVSDVKRFFSFMRDHLLSQVSYLLVAGGLGGSFGHYRAQSLGTSEGFDRGGGMGGMIKSVVKEWPEVRAHWVDLDLSESVDELAAYLELELLAENPLTEVGYHAGNRQIADVVKVALSEVEGTDHLNLNQDSVLLITGGAQGITAKLAVAMAARFACTLELVGRSPMPEGEEPEALAAVTDLIALRKYIIGQSPDLTPADIEKQCSQILSARAMRQTFADIEAVGGQVNYHAIDVRDTEAFGQLIVDLYQQHGKIDGVIHGAGVVEDKLLRHKTAESFERVFDTKVCAALLLSQLIHDDVKFVVFFSSVAGAFGNRGQVDYACANDALDKIAHNLQARVKGRVLSVNWGPWAGKGMVSVELEREYARKGIGLIPLDEGVDALLNELKHGDREDTQVVLMCATPESMDMAHE